MGLFCCFLAELDFAGVNMKNVDLKSMKDLNIVGFDLHYKDANGKMQVLKDGMIDIAKGSLAVKVNGKDINVVELLDTKSNISDAAQHAFFCAS